MLNNTVKTAILAGAGAMAYAGQAKAETYICFYDHTECDAEVVCSQNCTVTPSGTTCDEPQCVLVLFNCVDVYDCYEVY
jgi:hypothetical protein